MKNIFMGRSLCVIEDFSIEERKYLFSQVKKLKQALFAKDEETINSFRINNQDFGIYEVFLENSTRTKESFRNAAKFHKIKLTEMSSDSSSFNKGESYSDTFNTLSGYNNTIFIIRSKIEGVCRWLSLECREFSKRNNLPFSPIFINAGDGKHEHPTQELLDEFTFIEDNNWSFDSIHLAVVGDLFHGRTVHSKADGLKIFSKVKVDLIAPEVLQMPDSYYLKMVENGYEVRKFESIEDYLKQKDVADKWYFTRPQLERMGERILSRQEELRSFITFGPEFMDKIKPSTKFYHPLPRHKEHPVIPTFLDKTPFNAWERQSINGMYTRIVLLGLLSGKIGEDYKEEERAPSLNINDEEYISSVDKANLNKKVKTVSEGVHPIKEGLVIDHILKGEMPEEIRKHMRLICRVMKLDGLKGGEWVSTSGKEYKGIIFRPSMVTFDRKQLKRLAAVAPGCTLNIIKDGKVEEKFRTKLPPRIYNFDDLMCTNEACISNERQSENVPAMFYRTLDDKYVCSYCGKVHTFKEIWKNNN